MSYIQGLFGASRRRLVFTAAGAVLALPALSEAASVYTSLGAAGT